MPVTSAETVAYLTKAKTLAKNQIDQSELRQLVASLPPCDHSLSAALAAEAEALSLTKPRQAWAIMAVAEAAARRHDDLLLQATAAWRLARMANEWVRPHKVDAAISRARPLFEDLQEPAWVAACDWQQNALPWTRTDFAATESALRRALEGLDRPGFRDFLPSCRASLAYAQLLNLKHEEALTTISQSEGTFRQQNQWLSVARCLFIKSAVLLRQGQFEQALHIIDEAIQLIDATRAPADMARARYRRAQILVLSSEQYDQAEADLLAARQAFEEADLPLWTAQVYGYGLARLYRDSGRLAEAGKALRKARKIYTRYEIPGPRADNSLDSGKFALYQGQFLEALKDYRRAEALYRNKMDYPFMGAVSMMYQGETYGYLGRYQEALAKLEAAEQQLKAFKHEERIAECQLRLAELWLRLNQPDEVLLYLERVQTYLQDLGQSIYLGEFFYLMAEALFRKNQGEEAVSLLKQTLATLPVDEIPPLAAQLYRYLGEVLERLGRRSDALLYLQKAQTSFAEMGMGFEEATCWVAIGRCQARSGNGHEARDSWQKALARSGGALPEINWRVHAEMTGLTESTDDLKDALEHARRAVSALAQLRQWLWQPALAGSFLQEPSALFDRALALSARCQSPIDTLTFIEESKAQTSNRQLSLMQEGRQLAEPDQHRLALETEIRGLQDEIRNHVRANPGFLRPPSEIHLRQRFLKKVQSYNRYLASMLRSRWSSESVEEDFLSKFEIAHFQKAAEENIGGHKWVALDYYLTKDTLYCAVVTPDALFTFTTEISGSIRRALNLIDAKAETVSAATFTELGTGLIPQAVVALLDPETYLLIAPHGILHRLPWAALPVAELQKPLVSVCIPATIPSLRTLATLWNSRQAPAAPCNGEKNGLLLAVSHFAGRHAPLPEVAQEAHFISSLPGIEMQELRDERATWEALSQMAGEDGLSQFSFWHIATHAFHDALAGRLSGVALHDRDIWLDHLWQCAPLPQLITLSACSGGRSKVYTGDEHVGLTSTCLAAGAETVIGSLRPVQDAGAAELMGEFYRRYLQGYPAAHALALAQRAAAQTPGTDWQFFNCIGSPVTGGR